MRPRSTLTALAGALVLATAVPAVAHAGTVNANVLIRGSGMTQVVEGGAAVTCDHRENLDSRVTLGCAPFSQFGLFGVTVWLKAVPGTWPAGQWSFAGWSGCSATRTTANGVECGVSAGVLDATVSPIASFADRTPPTVTGVTASISAVAERTVAYSYASSDGTVQCRYEGEGSFGPCLGSKTYPSDGPKTVDVRAVDPSGNVSAIVSNTARVIDTSIDDGPAAGSTDDANATFAFSSGGGNAFDCSLDGGAWESCSGGSRSYAGLSSGAHTFRVRGRYGDWYDHIPATRTWTVDADPPSTSITNASVGGGASTTATAARFSFATIGGSRFECRLDARDWTPCASPDALSGIAPGHHTFAVRSIDAVGNPDPHPASWSWSVVTPPPPPPTPGAGPGTPERDRTAPGMALFAPAPQRALRTGAIRFAVTPTERCRLEATLALKQKALGTVRAALPGGRRSTLRLTLGRRARGFVRAALRHRPRATVSLAWRCTDAAGNVARSPRPAKLTLRR